MSELTGSFLVARPVLQDANFRQTVVLLLGHGDGGGYGVVVNRAMETSKLPVPVFNGGPCQSPGLVMLHAHADWVEDSSSNTEVAGVGRQVAPGIFVGDSACLTRASKAKKGDQCRFRVFHGYSGWGPGQLEQEIAAGAWVVATASPELLFDVPPADLWDRLSPRRIPEPSVN